jgi:hypothetical protein
MLPASAYQARSVSEGSVADPGGTPAATARYSTFIARKTLPLISLSAHCAPTTYVINRPLRPLIARTPRIVEPPVWRSLSLRLAISPSRYLSVSLSLRLAVSPSLHPSVFLHRLPFWHCHAEPGQLLQLLYQLSTYRSISRQGDMWQCGYKASTFQEDDQI